MGTNAVDSSRTAINVDTGMKAAMLPKLIIAKRWLLPLVGSSLGGLALGWGCAGLSSLAVGTDDLAAIGPILLGLISGYILGVAAGAYLTLKIFKQNASFWRALLGSVSGGVLLIILAFPAGLNIYPTLMWLLIITVPPVLSLVLIQYKWVWGAGRHIR